MNVLSLFDGCAGALQALGESGIRVQNYYSFEINEAAMTVAGKNHDYIDFMGNVLNVKKNRYENIDLLIGGPECTTYSVAGKMDAKGFWQIELFKWCIDNLKPKFWLMENVKSKSEIVHRIDECIGVKNKLINSGHFSAQSRERRYWSSFDIPEVFGDGPSLTKLITK
jgi:site-specific DNA-cytosine methylase